MYRAFKPFLFSFYSPCSVVVPFWLLVPFVQKEPLFFVIPSSCINFVIKFLLSYEKTIK